VIKPALLVVDDDESILKYLAVLLSSRGYEVECASSGEQALEHLAGTAAPAAVLLDLLLPGLTGLEVLDRITRDRPGVPVIVLSTVAQTKTVVDAMRRGAADYVTKPFQPQELELTVQGVLEARRPPDEAPDPRRRPDRRDGSPDFVSASPGMRRVKEIVRQVADTDAPVLLLGESGVGKDVVARFIHAQSRRRAQTLVRINCAALPQDLLESELFGYERGAFSGALREKPGMFELAHRGTILLDEIGEMSPHLQAKLLHVLQDGEFTRLGGRHPVRVDARVLASTNARLERAVAEGRFREDLYFRLNVIRIDIPPLRERREDIPMLCAHFLRSYGVRYNSPGRELPWELSAAFLRYDWPGNVRELENAVRRYVILPDLEMALADLRRNGAWAMEEPPVVREACIADDLSLVQVGAQAAEEAERKLLRRVLDETRWNRKQAASQLKISYKALLNKLKKWEVQEGGEERGREEAFPDPVDAGRSRARGRSGSRLDRLLPA
jgi:two-component system, NtrC family, response regulator AtoC